MEIRVLGDFDFAREIISGVARFFSYGNGFGYAAGTLLAMYLLILILKHALDPEKSPQPFKEFVTGILLFLMLGGGSSSAKFDVELISISDPTRFEQINDVPALAAVPAWLASNLFGEFRKQLEDEFTPVLYSMNRGVDPLGALVRLYSSNISLERFSGPDEDIGRTLREYMTNCYLADHQLDRAAPTVTLDTLMKANMTQSNTVLESVKVTYTGLDTRVYIGSPAELRVYGQEYGMTKTCPEAYELLKKRLYVDPEDQTQGYRDLVAKIDNSDFETDSIRAGLAMITSNASSENGPYAFALNLLTTSQIQAAVENSPIASEAHRMVFQGYNKHVVEKVGEASLFKKFMIPLVTALETFSFFVAPIMMVLAILGGLGLSYIMKYLGLVLYINLFGFAKVFVDLFTAISVQRSYEALDGAQITLASLPGTMEEVQGFLAMSGALTTGIPALTLFLLYGSAHTLSGAVKSMASGSVNGNVLAPEAASTMNGGSMNAGNQTVQYDANSGAAVTGYQTQSNAALSDINFSTGVQSAQSSQINSSRAAAMESSSQAMTQLEKAYNEGVKSTSSTGGSFTEGTAEQKGWSVMQGLVTSITSATKMSTGQALAFLASGGVDGKGFVEASGKADTGDQVVGKVAKFALGTSGEVKTGVRGGVGFNWGADYRNSSSEEDSKAKQAVDNYTKALQESGNYNVAMNALDNFANSKESGENKALKEARAAMESFKESEQVARSSNVNVGSAVSANTTGTLGVNNVSSALEQNGLVGTAVTNITQALNEAANGSNADKVRRSLSDLGLGQVESGKFRVSESQVQELINESSQYKTGTGNALMDSLVTLNGRLAQSDGSDYTKSVGDNLVNSAIWGGVASTLKNAGIGPALYHQMEQYSKAMGVIAGSASEVDQYTGKATELRGKSSVADITENLLRDQGPNPDALKIENEKREKGLKQDLTDKEAKIDADRPKEIMSAAEEGAVRGAGTYAWDNGIYAGGKKGLDKALSLVDSISNFKVDSDTIKDNSALAKAFSGFFDEKDNNPKQTDVPSKTFDQPVSGGLGLSDDSLAYIRQNSAIVDGVMKYYDSDSQSPQASGGGASGDNKNSGGLKLSENMQNAVDSKPGNTDTLSPVMGQPDNQQSLSVQDAGNWVPQSRSGSVGDQQDVNKVMFQGQELRYEDGRFDGIRPGEELTVGNTNYQLTNEVHVDDDANKHQVFKTESASYYFNQGSQRMTQIVKD